MSKKPDTASALAGILKAKRGDDPTANPAPPPAEAPEPETPLLPSPAPLSRAAVREAEKPEAASKKARKGKSSDKVNYSQFSVYLRKDTHKKAVRALDDAENGQDFSDLVQELVEKWLASRT